MPSERPLVRDDIGTSVTLVGYGETDDSVGGRVRRSVTGEIFTVADTYLFAGSVDATSCDGDSGGPTFADFGAGPVQIALNALQDDCTETVQRTRVDLMLTDFLYPYIDRFSGPCPQDGTCDEMVECRSTDPDCDDCTWNDVCREDCPTRDWDCPLGRFPGEACTASGECEEGGRCIAAQDDESFTYCSRPCDPAAARCPDSMACTDLGDGAGECEFLVPSPGSQGASCDASAQCRSGICEETICVFECDPSGPACPDPYVCGPSTVQPGIDVCLGKVKSGGGGFCAVVSPGGDGGRSGVGSLMLLALALAWLRFGRRH